MFRIPLGEYFEKIIEWLKDNCNPFFDGMKDGVLFIINHIESFLDFVPWWLLILILVILAFWLAGKKLAIITGLGLCLIYSIDLWDQMLETLALVFSSTFIALLIGIPLGILMAKKADGRKNNKAYFRFYANDARFCILNSICYFFRIR